jgi:hypothetical protein
VGFTRTPTPLLDPRRISTHLSMMRPPRADGCAAAAACGPTAPLSRGLAAEHSRAAVPLHRLLEACVGCSG